MHGTRHPSRSGWPRRRTTRAFTGAPLRATDRFGANRAEDAGDRCPTPRRRATGRSAIRRHTIANLDRYLEQFVQASSEPGASCTGRPTATTPTASSSSLARQRGRRAGRQGQVDDQRGDRTSTTPSGSRRIIRPGDRPGGVRAAAGGPDPLPHRGADRPHDPAAGLAPLPREAGHRRDRRRGPAGADRPRGAAEEVPRSRHGAHRGQLRRGRDGHHEHRHQRGQRAPVQQPAPLPRGADGHRATGADHGRPGSDAPAARRAAPPARS